MYSAVCYKHVKRSPYPSVVLEDAIQVWNYVNHQKRLYAEVRILDSQGYIAVIARKGQVIFPRKWAPIEMHLRSQL